MRIDDFTNLSYEHFERGQPSLAMRVFFDGLRLARENLPVDQWRAYVPQLRKHPVTGLAYLCPFTRHAYERPSGYPGDARLIDYIYGYNNPDMDSVTRAVYHFTTSAPASRAVRYRRAAMARLIDKTLHERGERAAILAVACGHLRELDLSHSVAYMKAARFIALDQDEISLHEVERCFGKYDVTPVKQNVRNLVAGRSTYEEMDLVYSAGLYDYLDDNVACRLTANLFRMLRKGGRLVIANFMPEITDVGYMEGVMDWWLTYRDAPAMRRLAGEISPANIAAIHQYSDPDDNLTFLEIVRA